jgi:phage shock protein B
MAAIIGSLTGLMFMAIPIVWIVMHYKYRDKRTSGFTEEESRQLEELMRTADGMAERVKTLESPDWRDQHEAKR